MNPQIIKTAKAVKEIKTINGFGSSTIWQGGVEKFLGALTPESPLFNLVVTSPPYNIGKVYEKRQALDDYLAWQEDIIKNIVPHIVEGGSLCWQVGNYVDNGHIVPLDIELHPIFRKLGLKLRNRIVWKFGHGLHSKKRFSGRYEMVMWYTKGDDYTFNLDKVRVPSKYPAKRHYKGPKAGTVSSNPMGKNPEDIWTEYGEDIWQIPNVKANHVEKTGHPCQFPVALIDRLTLALTNENDTVFDPFSGVGSTGVSAARLKRKFIGCELDGEYVKIAAKRIQDAFDGTAKVRPHDKPIYDHTQSKLSIKPIME
ncbi:DNA methyltransferase [Methylovorus sp. MM2]|uniref:DNA-methyltransferase n=1 Tax=Methylovorus sp. MM2 TaxID=1848038 RepID=UPI0007DFC9B9|nr:site-specific DNA-methyltransferase [Methylovorus sp. MM2]OAM52694.1 DNA methyltransferase [Methylovorus sp. MM2]